MALVAEKLARIGIHRRDRTTTYHHKPSAGIEIGSIGAEDKGKQGDQIGIRGRGCEVVVQSLGRQGADCRSCSFEEARGLSCLRNGSSCLQMAPVDVSRGYIASLGQQPPPLVVQGAASQRCYCVQEVTVDRNGVCGAPMDPAV